MMETTQIERDAATVLRVLAERRDERFGGQQLVDETGLPPERVNDAVAFLVDGGHAEWMRAMGTRPFDFYAVGSTARGRYELQRMAAADEAVGTLLPRGLDPEVAKGIAEALSPRPPTPVGSPYGFQDVDWEIVSQKKSEEDRLHVVLGHQFDSGYFDSSELRVNIQETFQLALDRYNETPGTPDAYLHYTALAAGYGEHLFNEIARDIISSDIAVFETSDHNPNVMIEMGVALTWGIRVLPIKLEGRPKPPSDISGQTWSDYKDSAASFVDADHDVKLLRMIERALRKKGRG